MTTLWPASVESAHDRVAESMVTLTECLDELEHIETLVLSDGERQTRQGSELQKIVQQIYAIKEVLYGLKTSYPIDIPTRPHSK